jgi:hypothetical protein
MLEKTCHSSTSNDAKRKDTIPLGKQKCGISCRLKDARIIVGFKEDSNADEYLENLKAKLYFLSWTV